MYDGVLDRGWGAWGGEGVRCRMSNLRNGNVDVPVTKKSFSPLSNSRNSNVTCHYKFPPPVVSLKPMSQGEFKKWPCHCVEFSGRDQYEL